MEVDGPILHDGWPTAFCEPQATHLATQLSGYRLCVLTFSLLPSFAFEIVSAAWFFLRDTLTASAASPLVETVPATNSPRVAKQNGHIVHLSGGEALIAKPLL
jgi:hypothetical protein